MYKLFFFLLTVLLVVATGCTDKQTNAVKLGQQSQKDTGFVGYVTSWDDRGRALVISTQQKNLGQKDKEYYSAIYFSGVPSNIKRGQKVSVEIDGLIKESMPAQSKAKRVKVFSPNIKKETKLEEYEAVARALDQQQSTFQVVKKIEYDDKNKEWHIAIKTPITETNQDEFIEKTIVVEE